MNSPDDLYWLDAGRGLGPEQHWSFAADAPLVSLDFAREAGEVIASDETGGVYLLDRRGQIIALTRGLQVLQEVAWSDDGSGGAAVVDESTLCFLNHQLKMEWTQQFPESILTIDISPYGNHVVVCFANGENRIFDRTRALVGRFETMRPLRFARFLGEQAGLIGAADYGLLCRYRLSGNAAWSESLWSNVGDLTVTGDGESIYLASFSYGIQRFDGQGENRGAYIVDGSPSHVDSSWRNKRLIVSTVERHLYWLDADGEMLWATAVPDEVVKLHCDAVGRGVVCGFRSGRILSLAWGLPEGT